ncbi:MAG: PKD domain-containing protein, partial [Bacteroidia bacterium]|nr:PKD domain-containing protein [Bacteroidia bacterium]
MQHTYNTAGTFSVQLKVTDASGCSDSITIADLVIATDPFPDFISADTLSCPGASVNFTNTSIANNYNSIWDFGDGDTSNNDSPSHVYAATGLYNVKLFIQDMYGCPDSINKNLFIRVDNPIADFTMSDSVTSCIPLEVQFTNTSSFYSSELWDFGIGQGTSSINNPLHYYNTPGNYLAKLTVTSPGGCIDTITKNITVFDISSSGITYTPINGCKPLMVDLTAFSPRLVTSYFWDFGDGYTETTTTPDISHLYASYGSFLPKVIMQDASGCIIPAQGTAAIPVTGAKVNFGFDSDLVCNNESISFIDSTTFNNPIASYNWSFGDGSTSSLQNPVHQYSNGPGFYDVSLSIQTQSGCNDTVTKLNAIKVAQKPLINIVGDSLICVNSTLAHSGVFLQSDTSSVTWSWNFPNGTISTLQNPAPQNYDTVGNFIIETIVINS